jgi:leader peptidase (prepilin peptidase) / N-methyltransferase
MLTIITIIFFCFGLIIGSFLNVVVYRYNTDHTLGGRSACMTCQSQLRWYDLIPLFSFFALKGRCRACETRISYQYPIVEFCSGVIFASLFWKFQDIFLADTILFSLIYGYYATLFCILLVISTYDLKHKIIPDALVFAFSIISFAGIFLFKDYNVFLHMPDTHTLMSGLLLALPFALIWLVSRGVWMGLGDAKLVVGLGYMLGIARGLSGIVLAFWSGAIIGLLLIFISRKGMKTEVPFAPFLVLGAFIVFLFELHLFPIGN